MTSYQILLSPDAKEYYSALDEKSKRIVRENLQKLGEEPYPGRGKGDKEKLPVDGEEIYRMHIGRTHTAFYLILEADEQVRIVDILTIEEAHKRYGY